MTKIPKINIMNIIGTIDLGIKLDLNKIKTHKDAEYNPNKFPGLVYRLKNPKTSYLLLENGKIICTGAKSEEELNLGIESLLDILEEKDIFEDYESIDMDFRLPNETHGAPIYDLRRDGHHGYHLHLLKLHNGKYIQTDYAFSIDDGKVYAFEHKVGKIKFKINNAPSNKLVKEIKPLILDSIKGINPEAWRVINNGKIHFFNLWL